MRSTIKAAVLVSVLAVMGCTKHEMKGKVLHIPLKDSVKTSDPTNVDDIIGAEVIYQIYEAPYQYNYFSDSASIIPLLADGMPTTSKDRLTVTFKIKKGIRYQNDPCFKATAGKGRELKAQDFIYAWKRHANPKSESQGFWIWDGYIAGINDFQKKFSTSGKPNAEVMTEEVEGFKALDDYTVQIKLTKPYPQLLQILTMSYTAPVPSEALETYGKDFVNHPVGTGPFRADTYQPTSRIVLIKNENFRDELFPNADVMDTKYKSLATYSGKKLPIVDAIDFSVVKEEQPRWLNFISGRFDEIEIPKDNFDTAVINKNQVHPELAKKGIYLSTEPSYSFWYVSMNSKDKLIGSNKYLRQAIASAIDAQQWLDKFKNGRGVTQNEVNPVRIADRCGKPYRWSYDLNRARQLLVKAGFPEGKGLPVLKYDTRNVDMSERQLAEFFQKTLAQIGIKTEININTFPAFLDKMHKGNLQISKGGWIMDYPDAQDNFQLLYGPNKSPGPNDANYENPVYDKIYEKVALMPSGPERKKLVCQLEEIIQEDAPWAYGIYEDLYRLGQKRLKNFHTAELVYNKWKYVDLE